MKKATKIRNLSGFSGNAALYELSEPHRGYHKVIVSATNVTFSGPETYIFGATNDGKVDNWSELPGSFRGALNHEQALKNAGYEV